MRWADQRLGSGTRLCRYIFRPAVAVPRLSLSYTGDVRTAARNNSRASDVSALLHVNRHVA